MAISSCASLVPWTFSEAIEMLFRDDCGARSLAEHVRNTLSLCESAVDPEAIASALGITIQREDIGAQAQYRQNDDRRPAIVLKKGRGFAPGCAREIERFALAHEIGHHVVREEIRQVWPGFMFSSDDQAEEVFCDRFAMELLLPLRRITTDLRVTDLLPDRL